MSRLCLLKYYIIFGFENNRNNRLCLKASIVRGVQSKSSILRKHNGYNYTLPKLPRLPSKSCLLVHTAALTDHVGAGACKRHELGVELEAGYWSCVLPI